MIDIDAIPLDLPKRQPAVAVYLAMVEKLPDGREIVMPHYSGPVWEWREKSSSRTGGCSTTARTAWERPTRPLKQYSTPTLRSQG